ncbi:MAG: hypothetical protein NT084_12860 [Bacteroidetes bacterium]|nr:hypothetical protein [Bacteroidota bacterium]
MKRILLLLLAALPILGFSQDVNVKITLNTTEGGFHSNMKVTLQDTVSKAKFSGTTDANGKVSIAVPPNAVYDMLIPNYTQRKLIKIPNAPGATMTSTLFYSRNMVQEEKDFAMSDDEKKEVDQFANALPDTTRFRGNNPFSSASDAFYSSVELELSDFKKGPLVGETVTLVGRNRHKAFKGVTDANGRVKLYLPKGDNYDLSFYYHKNFEYTECKYSKGVSEIEWSFEYIGTKAYAVIKKAEEARIAEEKKRLEADRKSFLEYCAAHHVTEEEGLKLKLKEEMASNSGISDNDLVKNVMSRNHFNNPLIVTDVTGSMSPYMAQLQNWFKLNATANPNMQFVFFNDGDDMADGNKKIGATGGIYYTPSIPVDQLLYFMAMVASKGSGGDCPENNMEALIKGAAMAKKAVGDIVMIADNDAPVKDISLLNTFTKPVHIIVCGCNGNNVHPDYLRIAWKTKGSIHTSDNDYNTIGNLKDGETITIGASAYRLMKGEFIRL